MQASELRDALEARGLSVLDVATNRVRPNIFFVYLPGPLVDAKAPQIMAEVPGVVDVQRSARSDVIFVITADAGEGQTGTQERTKEK